MFIIRITSRKKKKFQKIMDAFSTKIQKRVNKIKKKLDR